MQQNKEEREWGKEEKERKKVMKTQLDHSSKET